jgi:hypothetical protein
MRSTNLSRLVSSALAAAAALGFAGQPANALAAAPCEGMNTLTAAETAAAWKLLFDGKSLAGWHGYNGQSTKSWTIEDCAIKSVGTEGNYGSDLRADLATDREFTNFEISLEWKTSKGGNSGLMYGVVEDKKYQAAWKTGPEYQFIDDVSFPQKLEEWQKAGANYAMHLPNDQKKLKPVGEWNETKIVVNGKHVEHWLNGKKILEFERWTDDWKKLRDSGKWNEAPDYGLAATGRIVLQDHGSVFWFRNVKVRALAPDMYRQVANVHWVVKDLDHVKAGWAKLGFTAIQDLGEMTAEGSLRGQSGSARNRVAVAALGGANVIWIQPVEGMSLLTEHLARSGEGVMSINYAAPTAEALEAEVARLGSLGVSELQRAEVVTPAGRLTVVHMDTAAEGKYVLGLMHGPVPRVPAEAAPTATPVKLSQYALVVNSLEKVSAYWAKLGFPEMQVTHGPLTDLRYRGEPGKFDQKLGWHRHGTITWEWIEPLAGPTVYMDFMKEHGEGFHHFAFDVPDMDAATAAWEALGVPIVQSGGWGEKGKPGSGRFAYAATDAFGGVTTEFLWSFR